MRFFSLGSDWRIIGTTRYRQDTDRTSNVTVLGSPHDAPGSGHNPTGESPARVRRSEPPGNECCGRRGDARSEAYTAIAWGMGLSHEMMTLWRPRTSCAPKATCVVPLGAVARIGR